MASQERRRRKSLAPRLLGLAAPVAVIAAGLWLRPGPESGVPEALTTRVVRESLDRRVSATGVVRPVVGAEIEVGSRVSGMVRSILFEEGELVTRGDVLAHIDPAEFEADVARARADLAQAEAQLALAVTSDLRAAALAAAGIVALGERDNYARDLDVERARVASRTALLDSAVTRLGYTVIRAPIGGVIAEVRTREGETVAASFASPTFVTIVDLDRLEVRAFVDETDIGQIHVGQGATFSVDTYPGVDFDALVTGINPKAALRNGVVNYVVRLSFGAREDRVLRPEMTAHVKLQIERREDVLTVSRRAIEREKGQQFVNVKREGAFIRQDVETGWRSANGVEIQRGLAEGETVMLRTE